MTGREPIEVLSMLVLPELGERVRRIPGIRLTMTEDRAEIRRHLATARVLIARPPGCGAAARPPRGWS